MQVPFSRFGQFFAGCGVYFVPNQFTLGKKKKKRVLKGRVLLENRSQGHGGCGRKGWDPQGISPCGLEMSNSLNCPRFQFFFFFKNLYICAMSSQNPAQSSTKLLFFRRTLFPLAFLANLLFNAKLGCFFHQKSSFSGKSRTNPHSVGQIPGVVTFPHDFSNPCPAQPWNPLFPPLHCQ